MPFRFKCRECNKFVYIEELNEWHSNYPCSNCNTHYEMTAKQAIKFFNIEEVIEENIECPNCNKPQNDNAVFCKDCGTEIFPKELVTIAYCDKCESEYDESYQFCEKDGNQLVLKEKEIDESPQNIESVKRSANIVGAPQVSNDFVKDKVTDLPMNWYKFITYLLFPAGTLLYLYLAIMIGDDTVTISLMFAAVLSGIIIYGLHNRTSWSWKLLIILYDPEVESLSSQRQIFISIDSDIILVLSLTD